MITPSSINKNRKNPIAIYERFGKALFVLMFGLFLLLISCNLLVEKEQYSDLWGEKGEMWHSYSRLPDFSFAGYHEGLKAIPYDSIIKNIKTDYGAKGDGVTDDTNAFLTAISENAGVIFIPEGKYIITQILRITKSNLVFRGAGQGKTTLYFPKSLMDIEAKYVTPNSRFITGQTYWYHGKGGHIWVDGSFGQERIADVINAAERGDNTIEVSETRNLKVGQYIEVYQKDDVDQGLTSYLYGGDAGEADNLNTKAWMVAKIIALEGNTISLDRALRFKLDLKWKPIINSYQPSVSEVGIENLTIEYPVTDYKGHFFEENNAIYFGSITNSWVKNVTVLNADEAFLIHGRFCTLDGITVDGSREGSYRGLKGHNCVLLDSGGGDNLVTNFSMNEVYMHVLSVRNTAGNVFSNGQGENIDFDGAAHCPYANLFTDINIGKGTVAWLGSGSKGSGKYSAAWNTFWNIRSDTLLNFPPSQFGPALLNVVGCQSEMPTVKELNGPWFEPINPENFSPSNIYEAQFEKRKQLIYLNYEKKHFWTKPTDESSFAHSRAGSISFVFRMR